jgi:hypothetical protein
MARAVISQGHLHMLAVGLTAIHAAFVSPAAADTVLTLNADFIEAFKSRVTIDATYIVDKAHKHPNPPEKDGDLHAAGRSEQIGLPTVAEIENAADVQDAVDKIHAAEASGLPLQLSGVWRIWPEHGGEHTFVQGNTLAPFDTTNPPHVFEIHPVTNIDGESLLANLHPIAGFAAKDAEQAFTTYERTRSKIDIGPGGRTVTISTPMAGFNYVEFVMRLTNRQFRAADGEFVFANILDLDKDLLVHNRRIAFVADSIPDQKQKSMQPGDCLHLLGIPRVDLALVSWRVEHAAEQPEVLTWSMPYEIVAVGEFGEVIPASECGQ